MAIVKSYRVTFTSKLFISMDLKEDIMPPNISHNYVTKF